MTQPDTPIIVKLVEPKHDPTGLADVFLNALGLTGVIVLAALVCAGVFAVVLFWIRSRSHDVSG